MSKELLEKLSEPADDTAVFDSGGTSKLAINGSLVLEEYTFKANTPGWLGLDKLGTALAALCPGDPVWSEVKDRLIILSNGMMSYFVKNACEIAQHVRIDDATGTASKGGLFNQENVPSETLFYAVIHGVPSRIQSAPFKGRSAVEALDEFGSKVAAVQVFQFGADASTGLGYCSVNFAS